MSTAEKTMTDEALWPYRDMTPEDVWAELKRARASEVSLRSELEAARGEVAELRETLVKVRRCITGEDDYVANKDAIVDTLWMTPTETLVDFIEYALARARGGK